jgi:hypothetical protein
VQIDGADSSALRRIANTELDQLEPYNRARYNLARGMTQRYSRRAAAMMMDPEFGLTKVLRDDSVPVRLHRFVKKQQQNTGSGSQTQ